MEEVCPCSWCWVWFLQSSQQWLPELSYIEDPIHLKFLNEMFSWIIYTIDTGIGVERKEGLGNFKQPIYPKFQSCPQHITVFDINYLLLHLYCLFYISCLKRVVLKIFIPANWGLSGIHLRTGPMTNLWNFDSWFCGWFTYNLEKKIRVSTRIGSRENVSLCL